MDKLFQQKLHQSHKNGKLNTKNAQHHESFGK